MKWFLSTLIILILISCDNSTISTECTDSCNYNGEIICENNTLLVCKKLENACFAYKEIKSCTCIDDSQCLICDEGYVDNNGVCELEENNLCKNKECQDNSTCKIEDKNAVCICNEGYTDNNGICKLAENNPCKEKECQDNSSCKVENEIAICICDTDFHTEDENISCIPNTKKSNCKDISPVDASSDIIEVEITWNEETNSWNEIPECEWSCNENFHQEDNDCISNTKSENCTNITPPTNAHQVDTTVTITWNEEANAWNEIPECEWACNANYEKSGDECISTNLCQNFVCGVNSSCQVINNSATCICNNGFHYENNSCTSNSEVVSCDNSNTPNNAHQTTTTTTITWDENTSSWSTIGNCEWACNPDYEKDENICRCGLADSITRFHKNQLPRNAYQISFNDNNSWSRNNLNTYKPLVCDYNSTEDWYKIQLQEREYFNFKVTPTSGDAVIELYDINNTRLAYVDSHGGPTIETLIVGTPTSKLFYIKVRSYNSDNLLQYGIEVNKGSHEIRGTSFIYSIHPYYDYWSYNHHYLSDFETASSRCIDNSGHLIKIENEKENNFIKTQITGNSWIGLSDDDNEAFRDGFSSNWKWNDGTSLDLSNWNSSPWGVNQPNNGNENKDRAWDEDCIVIYNDWHDYKCSDAKAFICELN